MNKKKIDQLFETWINNYPESYNDYDMQRFYSMTKAVCIFGKTHRGSDWLRNKISSFKHNLDKEDIDYYCDLFVKLQKFYDCRSFWKKHNKKYNS
jgi:hypothetical protein